MDVANTEFDCWPVGCAREPQVEILAVFASFKEKNIIAGVQIGKRIQSCIVIV